MGIVNYKNLLSEPRNNIVELISDKANVNDPISTGSQNRKWIYSRAPDVKSGGFKGYPLIIIHAVRFIPEEKGSIGGKTRFVDWTLDIEILSSDRGFGQHDGKGLTYLDAISDDIVKTLLDLDNREVLKNRHMSFSTPVVSDVVVDPFHDELIYRRTVTAAFRDRITLSA